VAARLEGLSMTTPADWDIQAVTLSTNPTKSFLLIIINSGASIMRSPTPAKEVGAIGFEIDSRNAPKVLMIELSSATVADM